MKERKSKTVYRFQRKIDGQWKYILDQNKIPISITTDKHQNSVLYIFRHRYPSIANMYQLGETLVAVPDVDATKRLADFEAQQKEERDKRASQMWYSND